MVQCVFKMEEIMDFGTAILYVLAVIAIIAVAGVLIYLLAALVVSIIDKKEVKPFGPSDSAKEKQDERLLLEDKDYQLTFDDEDKKQPEAKQEEPKQLDQTVDLDLADEEQKQLEERQKAIQQPKEDEQTSADDDEDLDAMYQKLIADINSEASEEKEPEEVKEEPKAEPVKEEPVVEAQPATEPEVEEEPATEEPVEEVKPEAEEPATEEPKNDAEVEDLKAQLAALQAEKEELAKKLEEKPEVETVEVETESVESLEARKAVLEQRLSASEKDLKANKKEYIPLARIKKNLESDKAKLRRKEAVVAKQKVVLFGVNNYVVDPEKEKKLSEDLDVLDALRLSVQHCEEVMKDNEDRFPILEKTNAILTKQVEDLKADIADIDARIAKANGTDNGSADASTTDAK